MNLRDQAMEQYTQISLIADKAKTMDEIKQDLIKSGRTTESVWSAIGFQKKLQLMRSIGYLSENDFEQAIEKTWVIKQSFQIAAGKRKFLPPSRTDFRTNWQNFEKALLADSAMAPYLYKKPNVKDIEDFVKSVEKGGDEIPPYTPLFVHRDIISTSFALTDTPLPGSLEDRTLIRGSLKD
jgi:hypothetical protein